MRLSDYLLFNSADLSKPLRLLPTKNVNAGGADSAYRSELTLEQALLVRVNIEGVLSRLRKYRPEEIINAIAYVSSACGNPSKIRHPCINIFCGKES